ncbi:Protein arginine N-methyltransferase 7 [Bulinus truncatus]|nr:Protein arginine N-methyltransferase 7 [Bulinus truncatus]
MTAFLGHALLSSSKGRLLNQSIATVNPLIVSVISVSPVRGRSQKKMMDDTTGLSKRSLTSNTDRDNTSYSCNETGFKKLNDAEKIDATFVARTNPVTGKVDWVVQDTNYDYIQEIARSGYGDMLHDKDRNEKYYKAIGQAVKFLKEQGKRVKALDIGTGTGLLSMMSATMGADTVTACEAFSPMAACAKKVIEVNGFKNKIKLIPKRSTEVTLDDMGQRANLLVTELFDTELIGEGAIGSYMDAHARLLEDDCVAVPSYGLMYVQAVQSNVLASCNSLNPVIMPNNTTVFVPEAFGSCAGAPLLHDLQVDELRDDIKPMSQAAQVFRFDFCHKNALPKMEQTEITLTALESGRVDAFVMWWDLVMDPQGAIILSCSPCWTRNMTSPVPWRDHWMQAVYYPSYATPVSKGENVIVNCYHDEYSLWFDTKKTSSCLPPCTCGLHVTFSRSRIGQINEVARNNLLIKHLQKHITCDTVCLVISDGSLLPLFAARLGAKKVFYLDCNHSTRKFVRKMINHNNLQDKVFVLDKTAEDITPDDLHNLKIDLVVAEPFFQAALLPWEHLYFWYALHYLRSELSPNAVILPESMTVKAMAVQFRDLQKIRSPVGICEGFDITEFDKLIELSSEAADDDIEPQPLWEYPSCALSLPTSVAFLDFTKSPENTPELQDSLDLIYCRNGILNGLAMWTDYKFGEDILSTGLVDSLGKDEPKWDQFSRQGVKLFRNEKAVTKDSSLKISFKFAPNNGDFSFKVV